MLSMMTAQTTAFGAASALQTNVAARAPAAAMFGKSDLEALAKEQNPVLGYWDPMGLADLDLWGQGEEASIAWLRHAEIKHGRVAMAGFVGYIVHSNHITFPWAGPQSVVTDSMSAPEVWDAIPFIAKLQIIAAIGASRCSRAPCCLPTVSQHHTPLCVALRLESSLAGWGT